MTDPARNINLPPEIADAMETAGFSPEASTLMQIIADFKEAKSDASAAERAPLSWSATQR